MKHGNPDFAALVARLRAGTVTPADLDAAADAIVAAQPVVAVKPLVWEWSEQVQGWLAECAIMREVFAVYQSGGRWKSMPQMLTGDTHETADAAKAHIDQVRSARIRAELVPAQ